MIIWVYDRWGNQKGCLYELIDFAYDDEIGKVETIEFSVAGSPVEKGDYLVWRDEFLEWHEDIVASCSVMHAGSIVQHVYAEDSIVELALNYLDERDSYNLSNSVALTRCLENTRWSVGTVDFLGTGDIKFYHESVYQGLVDLQKEFGGELYTSKLVNSTGVYQRRINWVSRKGADNGLVFTYGFDADSIERNVELDNIFTRVHCFGKGEPTYSNADDPTEQTGNGRRITFSSINGGKDYVEDNDAMQRWGIIGRNGVKVHSEGVVVFDECTDENELLSLGKQYLLEVCKPRVTYKANVAILADAGMDFKNARAGDTVHIRDEVLDERLTGRVMHVRRYLVGSKPTEVTLGNVVRTVGGVIADQMAQLESLLHRSTSWDGAAGGSGSWLRNMQKNLNDEINATGGFVYWDYGEGITVYDHAVDQNPTMAIQLKGGALRIANSKTSTGDWDWRSFGTGNGFVADEIVAGVLRGGNAYFDLNTGEIHFEHGGIYDRAGKNFWNLDTGEFRLSPDTQYGDSGSLKQYFDGITKEFTDVDKALDSLDTNLRKAIEDGTITEAEAAAISKLLQRIQVEQAEAINAYNTLYSNSQLTGSPKTTLYSAKVSLYGTSGTAGYYGTLVTRINAVIACTTAAALSTAMNSYNTAYNTYKTAREAFTAAVRAAEAAIANKYADTAATSAVNAQTQQSIFNKLTNNGQTQGIYLSGGKVYINGSYIKTGDLDAARITTGTIRDKIGRNSWNLTTGALTTNYMTANNITATGSFTSGTTYKMELVSGTITGYNNNRKVVSIDTNLTFTDGNYGGRLTFPKYFVLRGSDFAVDKSSSGNGTIAMRDSGQANYVEWIRAGSNGSITWQPNYFRFIHGVRVY